MDPPSEPPSAPAAEPLAQKTAPLAPSQETAYRKKCIQLKRRLQEIEANNDATRRRIEREKQHIQKMRLNRAILLNHLKLIMEAPSKKLSPEQLAEVGVIANGAGHPADLVAGQAGPRLRDGQALLDDSSDESEEEPEPAERPERRRRNNPAHGESIMSTNLAPPQATATSAPVGSSSAYPASSQPSLSNVVPATATVLPSTARSTSNYSFQHEPSAASDQKSPHPPHAQHQSPTSPSQGPSQSNSFTQATPPLNPVPPVRPDPPFKQFTDHMRPQLEADDYDPKQIDSRIQSEWDRLSPENLRLWEVRYHDQMAEYTRLMDEYKRQQRQQGGSFSESRNRTLSGSGVGS
ncbi:hypothetical protein DV738_g1184, partial [Chaetothyriales sp. CBS 135597]